MSSRSMARTDLDFRRTGCERSYGRDTGYCRRWSPTCRPCYPRSTSLSSPPTSRCPCYKPTALNRKLKNASSVDCDTFSSLYYPRTYSSVCSGLRRSCSPRIPCYRQCSPICDPNNLKLSPCCPSSCPAINVGSTDAEPSSRFLEAMKSVGSCNRFQPHLCPWEADVTVNGIIRAHCTSTADMVSDRLAGPFKAFGRRFTPDDGCDPCDYRRQKLSIGMLDDGNVLDFSRNHRPTAEDDSDMQYRVKTIRNRIPSPERKPMGGYQPTYLDSKKDDICSISPERKRYGNDHQSNSRTLSPDIKTKYHDNDYINTRTLSPNRRIKITGNRRCEYNDDFEKESNRYKNNNRLRQRSTSLDKSRRHASPYRTDLHNLQADHGYYEERSKKSCLKQHVPKYDSSSDNDDDSHYVKYMERGQHTAVKKYRRPRSHSEGPGMSRYSDTIDTERIGRASNDMGDDMDNIQFCRDYEEDEEGGDGYRRSCTTPRRSDKYLRINDRIKYRTKRVSYEGTV